MWTPYSWKNFPAQMQPDYEDLPLKNRVLEILKNAGNLVSVSDILELRNQFSLCEQGKSFILQAGDCAEPFSDCVPDIVSEKVDFLLELKHILQNQLDKPVIPIGRIAGQYAKPRSEKMETIQEKSLLNYCGDIINGFDFNETSRKHDPSRLLQAYAYSQKTLAWIDRRVFTSHEALLLDYESALTREIPSSPRKRGSTYFNFSAHMLWLGERTKALDGAHVEYLRGIQNPIGVKIGPSLSADELVTLISILNPNNETGKINLITRMGSVHGKEKLPHLINAVQKAKKNASWSVDPMHGNTKKTKSGKKTRYLDDCLEELILTKKIHLENSSFLSGIHIETSPFDITECVGGKRHVSEFDLDKKYESLCDPRLNKYQSIDLVTYFCNVDKLTSQ